MIMLAISAHAVPTVAAVLSVIIFCITHTLPQSTRGTSRGLDLRDKARMVRILSLDDDLGVDRGRRTWRCSRSWLSASCFCWSVG